MNESEKPRDLSLQQVKDLIDAPELAHAIENEEFRRVLDCVPIAVAISQLVRGHHRIAYANAALERLCGVTLEQCRGRPWSTLDHLKRVDEPGGTLGQALMTGGDFIGTFRVDGGDPSEAVDAYAAVIENDDGTEKYRVAALVKAQPHDQAQRARLIKEIRDKDMLLREIQHRVKNNLQLITTLIRIEARYESSGDQADLARLAGRIEALQYLYQALASAQPAACVDLGHYLGQIATASMRAHGMKGIRLDTKIENVTASVNVAMPLGLIVNELLTNAFKHAFTGRETGTIKLECLRRKDRQCSVVVADDGIGLPRGLTWPNDGKMGSLILQTLRENTAADLSVEAIPGAGTRITIGFECDAAMSEAA
jgi:two-component sensor histidine kinase